MMFPTISDAKKITEKCICTVKKLSFLPFDTVKLLGRQPRTGLK